MGVARPVEDRLWEKVEFGDWLDCWTWTAYLNAAGYGVFGIGQKTFLAHRVAYELLVEPLGDRHLDHVCHSEAVVVKSCKGGPSCPHRRCVNPLHLEPVTQQENNRRGIIGPNRTYERKSHCLHGHPLDGDNLYEWKGQRACKTCRRERLRAWQAARRAG